MQLEFAELDKRLPGELVFSAVKKSLLLSLFLIGALLGVNATATTYYIDSVSGDDARNGTSPFTPWQSLANAGKPQFSPGDQILLKRGGIWRETLSLHSSGTPGNPIVIDAYGDGNPPIISGADPASEWAQFKDNIYQAYVGVRPHVVMFDGAMGIQQAGLANLTAPSQWHWAGGSLYIYSNVDPESAYTKPDITAGVRANCIVLSSSAYVSIRNITVTGGNGNTGEIYAEGRYGAKNIEIHHMILENGASDGVRFDHIDNALIDSSTITFMGRHSVALAASSGTVVEKNLCDVSGASLIDLGGEAKSSISTGNIVRYNVLRNGSRDGIVSSKESQKNEIYYNLIYNLPSGSGILLKGAGHKIYNNTLYNNLNGIVVDTRGKAGISIKNNIIAQAANFNIQIVSALKDFEADHNNYQGNGTNKFEWGEAVSDFEMWRKTSGQDAHSFLADPKFAAWGLPRNPEDFQLGSGSPDIDSGTPLPSPYRLGLSDQNKNFPYSLADQNSSGKGWEIGAFVYTH